MEKGGEQKLRGISKLRVWWNEELTMENEGRLVWEKTLERSKLWKPKDECVSRRNNQLLPVCRVR